MRVAVYWKPRHLTYDYDWRDALTSYYPASSVHELADGLVNADVIYWLHSLTAQKVEIPSWLKDRKGKLVVLTGNDYKLLDEKKAACEAVGADVVGTLAPNVGFGVHIPHGLHKPNWPEGPEFHERPIKIGFKGYRYPEIGSIRNAFVEAFMIPGLDVNWEVFINPADYRAWLATCKATVATEAGMAGKAAVSSRHFEAIGTRTALIMPEGDYSGCLTNEHFFEVKRDLSNVQEAVRRAMDESEWETVTRRALEHVEANHTIHHRIRQIEGLLWP